MTDATPSKACATCGAVQPLSGYPVRKRSSDGRADSCSDCKKRAEKVKRRLRYEAKRETILAQNAEYRRLNQAEVKARQALRRELNRDLLREKNAAYVEKNRQAIYQRQRERYQQDPEPYRQRARESHKKNKAANNKRAKQYRAKNKELIAEKDRAYREANRERKRQTDRAWREANPEARLLAHHRRRARKSGSPQGPPINLGALWTGRCALCGDSIDQDVKYPDPASKSLDHKIPLALGGAHSQDNLQYAHLGCNVAKGAREMPQTG